MPCLLDAIPLIFAQNAQAANPEQGVSGLLTSLPFVLVVGFWFYFLLIRPSQQQDKRRRSMIAALKKNDKIITTGGLYGTVMSIDPDQDRIVLRVDDDKGVKLTFSKSVIGRIVEGTSDKSSDNA